MNDINDTTTNLDNIKKILNDLILKDNDIENQKSESPEEVFIGVLKNNNYSLNISQSGIESKKFAMQSEYKQKINYLTAVLILHSFTSKYPNEIWTTIGGDTNGLENQNNLANKSHHVILENSQLMDKYVNSLYSTYTSRFDTCMRYLSRKELEQHMPFKNIKIEDMLISCFFKNYFMFSPKIWLTKLSTNNFENDIIDIREGTVNSIKTKYCNGYSISVRGADHKQQYCDDFAYVGKIKDIDNVILAVCADGVGSASKSRYGSYRTVDALSRCIIKQLGQKSHLSKTLLIGYLFGNFRTDLVNNWEKSLIKDSKSISTDKFDIREYATSLQFAILFKNYNIVFCGVIGDGVFVVENKSELNKRDVYGYHRLSDGVSGVTRSDILTLGLLKSNVNLMKLFLFDASEINTIIIGSDGIDGLLYKNIDGLLFPENNPINAAPMLNKLRGLTHDERKKAIKELTHSFSIKNGLEGGKGDDSSMAILIFNDEIQKDNVKSKSFSHQKDKIASNDTSSAL